MEKRVPVPCYLLQILHMST